jgi:hypothetical protein
MKDVEDLVSPIIEQQFPQFYQKEGVDFIEFTKEYYKWMETQEGPVFHARRLPDYRDIDKTIDDFVVHFKEKYLRDFPLDESSTSNRFLIKHIMDFYRAKGTERGLKIFMRAKFGDVIDVYYPGRDVFRLSAGHWLQPKYIELVDSPRLVSLVGKEITGSSSGAQAFVENIIRRRVAGRYINVAFISNVRGNFMYSEFVSEDGVLEDAPRIVGSLTELEIIDGGEEYAIGDVLTVLGEDGMGAKVRVTGITTEAGVVSFNITDGGWGYTSNAYVLVSQKVLGVTNTTSFARFATVHQPIETIDFISANANFAVGDVVDNYYTNGVHFSNGVVLSVDQPLGAANGTIVVAPYKDKFISAANVLIYTAGNTKVAQISLTTDTSASGNTIGTNTAFIGTINVTSSFVSTTGNRIYSDANTGIAKFVVTTPGQGYVNGETVAVGTGGAVGEIVTTNTGNIASVVVTTGGSGYTWLANTSPVTITTVGGTSGAVNAVPWAFNQHVSEVSLGADASFDIGTLSWKETVRVAEDFVGSNNFNDVAYLGLDLDATEYGFPKMPSGNSSNVILDLLTFSNMQVGRIETLSAINRGAGYNRSPFVVVLEPFTAGAGKRDFVMQLANVQNGSFNTGEYVRQTDVSTSVIDLTVDIASGAFEDGEIVWQYDGAANNIATVYSSDITANSGLLRVLDVIGTFQTGLTINGATSGTTANVQVITSNTVLTSAKGLVVDWTAANSTLTLQRISYVQEFTAGSTIINVDSGTTAQIVDVTPRPAHPQIGLDAEIVGSVQTANSVVATVEVIDAGIGYMPNSTISLIGENSNSVVTARAIVTKQGISEGHYKDTNSFVSDDKKLHDGTYYQDFSYEIQSKISLDVYASLLKKVAHVAGTKFFGRFISKSEADAMLSTYQHTLENVVDISANAVSANFVAGEQIALGSNTALVVGAMANTVLSTVGGDAGLVSYPSLLYKLSPSIELTVGDVQGSFVDGSTIAIANGSIAANITTSNASHIVVSGANGVFLAGDAVYGPYIGKIGFESVAGTFSNNETITQGAVTAQVVGVDETTISFANGSGVFVIGSPVEGSVSGAIGTATVTDLGRPAATVLATNNQIVGLAVSHAGGDMAIAGADLSTDWVNELAVAARSREVFLISAQATNTATITVTSANGTFAKNETITGNTSGATANVQSVVIQVR